MKKVLYTIALVTLFGVVSKAQSSDGVKKDAPKKTSVNADGTLGTPQLNEGKAPQANDGKAPQQANETKQQEPNKQQNEKKPAGGTRMAITEKGVPASKAKKEEAKDTKAAEPKGQPSKTEKTEKH